MKPGRGSGQLRKSRYDATGFYYVMTTVVAGRRSMLATSAAAQVVLEAMLWLDENRYVGLEAGVVMPDHFHMVVERKAKRLPAVMHSLKGHSAKRLNMVFNRSGKVWQAGYHDHALRKDENLMATIQYCLNNPVRAGIVAGFHEYPYWYCRYMV